jgi:hypothetical protein
MIEFKRGRDNWETVLGKVLDKLGEENLALCWADFKKPGTVAVLEIECDNSADVRKVEMRVEKRRD